MSLAWKSFPPVIRARSASFALVVKPIPPGTVFYKGIPRNKIFAAVAPSSAFRANLTLADTPVNFCAVASPVRKSNIVKVPK